MSRTILLSPGLNLIDEIEKYIDRDSSDLSDHLVIFPGKRPGHFLRKKLGTSRKKSYIPPRILSIETFIEWIYREKLQRSARAIPDIDAVAVLYDLYLKNQSILGGNHFGLLEDFLPIGFGIFNEIEELKLARISSRRLLEAFSHAQPFKEAGSIAFFFEEFYAEISKRGLVTRALMYTEVAEFLDRSLLSEFRTVIAAGLSALTETEKSIFARLRDLDNCIFLFQNGRHFEKQVERLHLDAERKGVDSPTPAISLTMAPDGHGEVFALTAEVAQMVENNAKPDERVVIVLPDTNNLFPVINETLPLLERDDYNISLGYPVVRTPVFAFLNCILDVISSMHMGQLYSPDYFKLVLHPYTKNIRYGARTDVTRILFHTIEEKFAGSDADAFFQLESIEQSDVIESVLTQLNAAGIETGDEDLRSHLNTIHDNVIRRFTGISDLGSFANTCIDVLKYIHDNSTANLHVYFGRFIEVTIRSLQEISSSLVSKVALSEPSSYCSFIRRYLGFVRVPFEGTPLHGLQILGFLETRNLNFDKVYILDCNDDVLPGARGSAMLLPQKAREFLGLPTYRDREELAAYYFDVLVRGAKEVHCYFIQNDKKEKSRFVEQLLWERQQREGKEDAGEYIGRVQYKVSLKNDTPATISKSPDTLKYLRSFPFSASSMDRYLRCQLKFYYADVLRLREKEVRDKDIEGKDIGTLVHSVLKKYFLTRKGKPLKSGNLGRAEMEAIINREFSEHLGDEPYGMKFLLKRQIVHQLGEFLERYQAPQAESQEIVILDVERKIKTNKHSFLFEGYVDRIEKRGADYYILDYKTGGNDDRLRIRFNHLSADDRESWNEAIGSLQLPLYVMMYANETKLPIEQIKPVYLMIGRNRLSAEIEIPLVDEDVNCAEKYELLETIIVKLLGEIVDGKTPFSPPKDLKKVCPDCPFTYICGTQWVEGWSLT
jgi:ATP-dependent helicase/nuclease subunit B